MLKSIIILSFASLLVLACHKKTVPTAASTSHTTGTVYAAADIEAGRVIYTAGKCVKCHAPKPVENWSIAGWQPILKSMIPNAKLDSVQTMQLNAYVNTYAKKE